MSGVYVYGVMRGRARPRLPARGVENGVVGRVQVGALAALVSTEAPEPVRPSRRNLMAHSEVLQAVVAAGGDVLPMRFGVVMPDATEVREELLGAHHDDLVAQLDALADMIELGVTVTCPEEVRLREIVAADSDLAVAARRPDPRERMAAGESVAQRLADQHDAGVRQALDVLGPAVADIAVGEPRHDDELLGLAFLVARPRLGDFDAALERLGERLTDECHVRCVGPLPPYHFVEVALAPKEEAWG